VKDVKFDEGKEMQLSLERKLHITRRGDFTSKGGTSRSYGETTN